MTYRAIAALALLTGLPLRGSAQAARVGRLDVLDVPTDGATCTTRPASAELRRSGIVRMLDINDTTAHRLLSLGVNAVDEPQMLLGMRSTRDERRGEGESVTVFFGKDGAIVRGTRSAYTTGTPARRTEDRRLGLLPTDSAQVRTLVRAVRRVCRT